MSKNLTNQQRMARRSFIKRGAVIAAAGCSPPLLRSISYSQTSESAATKTECQDSTIPMKDVSGKVAFITGGSSGIGLGIARTLAAAGMRIIVTYRDKNHLQEALSYLEPIGDRLHAIDVDVTDRLGMEQAAKRSVEVFGKVHVLVNNAGIQNPATLGATHYDDWDRLMAVNLGGVFNGIRAFLPHMKEHGEGGQIVTTSSVLGLVTLDGGGAAAYCASKFAVVGMMEALRAELGDTNIGVSLVCPGLVKSNLEAGLRDHPRAVDPLVIGEFVLQGIRNNDLYIMTHPEFEPLIRQRSASLLASIPKGLPLTEARTALADSMTQRSIYRKQLNRITCRNPIRR